MNFSNKKWLSTRRKGDQRSRKERAEVSRLPADSPAGAQISEAEGTKPGGLPAETQWKKLNKHKRKVCSRMRGRRKPGHRPRAGSWAVSARCSFPPSSSSQDPAQWPAQPPICCRVISGGRCSSRQPRRG